MTGTTLYDLHLKYMKVWCTDGIEVHRGNRRTKQIPKQNVMAVPLQYSHQGDS